MPDHFLVLFPKNPAWAPASLAPLTNALKHIGLIGAEREAKLFSAGPEYLGLITYLGCSPHVSLGENAEATTIRLSEIAEAPEFVRGTHLRPPRCPKCRKNVGQQPLSYRFGEGFRCGHCGNAGTLSELDWRRGAAFARVFIEISNVFESEAVPAEALGDCLSQATGEEWDYCYLGRDESSPSPGGSGPG